METPIRQKQFVHYDQANSISFPEIQLKQTCPKLHHVINLISDGSVGPTANSLKQTGKDEYTEPKGTGPHRKLPDKDEGKGRATLRSHSTGCSKASHLVSSSLKCLAMIPALTFNAISLIFLLFLWINWEVF